MAKKVFIGVGHGGTDSGAVANGLKEKLYIIQNKEVEDKKRRLWKGRAKDE